MRVNLIKEEGIKQLMLAIDNAGGNAWEVFDRFRRDCNFTNQIAHYILEKTPKTPSTRKSCLTIEKVSEIMGKNFFGTADWMISCNIDLSKRLLCSIPEFTWSEEILNAPCPFIKGKSVKETHFAFLGLDSLDNEPLNSLKFFSLYFDPNLLHSKRELINDKTCSLQWYLILKEVVPDSYEKTYQEQLAMLPLEYEVPSAVEEIAKNILFFKKNGIYLNRSYLARCHDGDKLKGHLVVGYCDDLGPRVYDWPDEDDAHNPNVGIAASRLPGR